MPAAAATAAAMAATFAFLRCFLRPVTFPATFVPKALALVRAPVAAFFARLATVFTPRATLVGDFLIFAIVKPP